MSARQFRLDLNGELIVDNFAGGGGASTGIFYGLGRHVDFAVNHNWPALCMHMANHPQTRHLQEDVFAVQPRKLTGGRPVGLAWFSPDCTHFSKAKGGKPRSKKIRGLAWVILRWAVEVRPRVMMMENVEEIQTWGPLLDTGHPDKAQAGLIWEGFKLALTTGCPADHVAMEDARCALGPDFPYERLVEGLGYVVETREIRACTLGLRHVIEAAPTIRKRLFGIMRCDGRPIVWPASTNGDPKSREVLAGQLKPYRVAAECIDWSLPCPSIFLSKAEARKLGVKRPLAEATERRIARGIRKFVIDAPEPFIVPVTHQGSDRVENIREPMRTVTGAHRGEKALAMPFLSKYYGERRPDEGARGVRMTDPLATQGTENRFAIVTAFMGRVAHGEVSPTGVKRWGAGVHSVEAPLGTVTRSPEYCLVAASLANCANSKTTGRAPNVWDLAEPLRTVTTGPGFAVVAANITKFRKGSVGTDCREPLHTICAGSFVKRPAGCSVFGVVQVGMTESHGRDARATFHCLACDTWALEPMAECGCAAEARRVAFLAKHFGGHETPGSSVGKPMDTVTAVDHHAVVSAALVGCGGRAGQSGPRGLEDPVATITAKADTCVTAATLVVNTTEHSGGAASEPLKTVTTGGHHALTAATLVQSGYGERDGQAARALDIQQPLGTAVAGGVKHAVVSACLLRHFGASVGGAMVSPMGTIVAGGAGKTALVTSHLAKMYDRTPGHEHGEPMHTVTSGGLHLAEVRAFLIKYYKEGGQDAPVSEPMHTMTAKARMGLVTVRGVEYVIADIGMRMLVPRELYRAQGFPEDYVINVECERVIRGKKVLGWLPQDEQVRMVGNSVPPPIVAALVAANLPEMRVERVVAAGPAPVVAERKPRGARVHGRDARATGLQQEVLL